jgi:hypothetical protein
MKSNVNRGDSKKDLRVDRLTAMSASLNLPEDRTPGVLSKETVWKAVKRSYLRSVAPPLKDPFAEAELDATLESLSDEVIPTVPTVPTVLVDRRKSLFTFKGCRSLQDKNYVVKTTKMVKLEFRQILKIDNLDRLTSLTR